MNHSTPAQSNQSQARTNFHSIYSDGLVVRGRFRFLLALGPPGASARTSSCVIANHKIQYFLYFRGNASMLFRLKRAFGATNMAKLGHFWFRMLAVLLACAAPFQTIPLTADQVPV